MNRFIHRRILPALESLVFSFTLITVTAGMKIINPKNVSWLQDGDGTAELSWEFFRRQSLVQFPIGKNPNYGLEISNSIAFDGAIPLMSLILRPFSFLMGDRFQYFGLFLFVTFALNYLIAKKIFMYLEFNNLNSSLSAIIVSLSPIILNRYIENTHYSLTAAFLIFYGIFLVLRNDLSLIKWNILFALCVLIHIYYGLFIFALYIVFLLASLIRKSQTVAKMFINLLIILGTNLIIMYVVGYFYGGVSSADVGYGLFRSTFLSLVDPSGWSIILPDLEEPDGAYEGFSFLGFNTLFLLTALLVAKFKRKVNLVKKVDFAAIWVTSITLFIFSLSNKISFGKRELIEFKVPELILPIINSFRSSGRFSWLLVFAILFWILINLNSHLKPKNLTILLLLSLIVGLVDAGPQLLSQRYKKFSNQYKNNLTNKAWGEIGECYNKIRVYPPVPGVDNYYNFVNLANKLDLGVNTGRFSRVNSNSLKDAYTKMHKDFIFGNLEKDSLYVFTTSQFAIPEAIDFRKNIALFGLNDYTMSGKLNDFTVIAPDILLCEGGVNLKNNLKNLGVPKIKKYNLKDQLKFGLNQDLSKYILSGFSDLQDWGVWTVGDSSDLIIHTNSGNIPNKILIKGKIQSKINNSDSIGVEINNIVIGKCNFELTLSSCVLEFKDLLNRSGPLQISFTPENPMSSKELNLSDESIPYGLGLISVQLARD